MSEHTRGVVDQVICVVGAILFWVIDKFVRDGRLGNLLKILVVLVCLEAILQRGLFRTSSSWVCDASPKRIPARY